MMAQMRLQLMMSIIYRHFEEAARHQVIIKLDADGAYNYALMVMLHQKPDAAIGIYRRMTMLLAVKWHAGHVP